MSVKWYYYDMNLLVSINGNITCARAMAKSALIDLLRSGLQCCRLTFYSRFSIQQVMLLWMFESEPHKQVSCSIYQTTGKVKAAIGWHDWIICCTALREILHTNAIAIWRERDPIRWSWCGKTPRAHLLLWLDVLRTRVHLSMSPCDSKNGIVWI